MLKQIKKISLTDSIIRQIISYIQTDLNVGDKLPSERNLIDLLGVGRTSVRESLRALEMLGIVETRPGEGTFVSSSQNELFKKPIELGIFSNQKSIQEIYEARRALEIGMVPLVVENMSQDELAQCRVIVEKMRVLDTKKFDDFIKYDQQFHRIIAASTKNSIISEMLKLTHRILEEERKNSRLSKAELEKSVKFHEEVIAAIETRNVETVTKAVIFHMDWTREILHVTKSN